MGCRDFRVRGWWGLGFLGFRFLIDRGLRPLARGFSNKGMVVTPNPPNFGPYEISYGGYRVLILGAGVTKICFLFSKLGVYEGCPLLGVSRTRIIVHGGLHWGCGCFLRAF